MVFHLWGGQLQSGDIDYERNGVCFGGGLRCEVLSVVRCGWCFLRNEVLSAKHAPKVDGGSSREEAKKFEVHKNSLLNAAYRFTQNSQLEAKQCMERALNRMAYQILNVQNGAYFKLKMYRRGHIAETTAMKVGLFQRVADDLNICSDYLREGDLRIMVREIAVRFARHLQELLIGFSSKPPRMYRADTDTKHIVDDFEECKKLFYDFDLQPMYIRRRRDDQKDDDEERSPSPRGDGHGDGDGKEDFDDVADCDPDDLDVDTQHPFYPYFMCVENMKQDTITLMQKHMVMMANRNEAQKVWRPQRGCMWLSEQSETESLRRRLFGNRRSSGSGPSRWRWRRPNAKDRIWGNTPIWRRWRSAKARRRRFGKRAKWTGR